VRDSHTAVNRKARKKVFTTASVVMETDYLPPPEEDAELQLLPKRKRALKPSPAARTPQVVHVTKCSVLVQIIGVKTTVYRSILRFFL
jgi:hypothetical protein